MFYSYEITVPKSTAVTSPLDTLVRLTYGTITRVSFRPRPGHNGLCHCRVLYHEHQLFPTNRDADLHGDTFPIEWDENEEIFTEPFELKIRAWNIDDTYAHSFDVSFALMSPDDTLGAVLSRALSNIASIFSPRRIFGGG